ncbi:MAG: aminotransferase class I/II-fold pyridoxal phosphate-dependent enzyme [Oscillospiraceae bacterium]|nr:aminotransferase class I/II-fold pyridoxal phosphate-dependent enzyme [Oscillospiraceae bacterium]
MNYENVLNNTIKEIKPSGIRKFFDIAATIDGVISLGVGEPDFPTPWSIRQKAIQTIETKRTVYTANSGLMDLRKAISDYTIKRTGVQYHPEDEVIVTVGGSEAIDISIRSIVSPGDEVLIVEPCFVCYSPIVRLSGGIPVTVQTKVENNFKLKAGDLKDKITDKTKLLILPFPNNPTGAIMTREDLEEIAEVLRGTDILILSDEIYSELTYGKKHCSVIEIDGMRERTIMINGFSKAFAMTGWRLGYLCAPAPLVRQIVKIHQFAIMCSPTVSQYAGIEALTSCDREVAKMVDEYNVRRRFLVGAFNKLGLSCFNPEGAFYVFPCIAGTGLTSEEFCEKLLYLKKVAVVPGNAFGDCGEGYIRVSYAYSLNHLNTAISRIKEFLQEISDGR